MSDRLGPAAPSLDAAAVVPVGRCVRVRVPASSANLGPGYDSMGLALGRYDDLELQRIEEGLEFFLEGQGVAAVPRTEEHLVLQAVRAAWAAAGVYGMPGLRLRATNRIPHSRGMGSSASAVVAGVLAGNGLLPQRLQLSQEEVLQVCSQLEGHPDNVAPSLYGGMVVSWAEGDRYGCLPVAVLPEITPVVAVPDYEVSTRLARSLVPSSVPHHEAAADAGRAALLGLAMTQRPEALFAATEDFLHQQYRAAAMAPSAALVGWLRDRGFPAVVSGAGPTVLVLAVGAEQAAQAGHAVADFEQGGASQVEQRHVRWDVEALAIDAVGAIVEV